MNRKEYNKTLYHHGIKGQKWGIRRSKEELGYKVKRKTKRILDKEAMIQEVIHRGDKITPKYIHDIVRTKSGKIVWLETGYKTGGLKHILDQHRNDFRKAGISDSKIVPYIMTAVEKGDIVGIQGRNRPVYEFTKNNQLWKIAVQTGSNGYIVGANPVKEGKFKRTT